jgi:hypothetical protein
MQKALAATLAASLISSPTLAQPFSRSVPPGQTTVVFTYRPFVRSSCNSASAVAKLSIKPKHGRVSHYLTPATIPTTDRFTGQPSGCAPKPTTGFAVTYTPAPGFHGTDMFSLDVHFQEIGKQTTDVFTINVE